MVNKSCVRPTLRRQQIMAYFAQLSACTVGLVHTVTLKITEQQALQAIQRFRQGSSVADSPE